MKPKILIVDDDEAIRTQMKWALGEHYEVHFAEDRQAAGEGFEANAPAVTLLDLGLPPRPNECDEGLAVLSDILGIDNAAKVMLDRRRATLPPSEVSAETEMEEDDTSEEPEPNPTIHNPR